MRVQSGTAGVAEAGGQALFLAVEGRLAVETPERPRMRVGKVGRSVVPVLLGLAGLVLKSRYHGRGPEAVHAWGGNFAVLFAVYVLSVIAASRPGVGRIRAALSALLVVETFEVTDRCGVMSNIYDPVDLVANVAGVGVALALDLASQRSAGSPSR